MKTSTLWYATIARPLSETMVGVLDARLVAHRLDVVDDVVGVLLERVVDARLEVRLRAVVVDAQPAADVEVLEPGAVLHELGVDPRRLVQRALDDADVGDLAAQVEVQELEAVLHARAPSAPRAPGAPRPPSGRTSIGSRPDDCQRPPPRAASLTRMPMFGRTPTLRAYSRISPSSVYFSTTGMIRRPILWASIAISMNSASLKPLQMIGVSFVGHRHDRQQLGLRPGLQPEIVRAAEVQHLLDDLPLLVDLDRIDAEVLAFVLVLGDGRLERARDVGEPLPQDVAKPDEDRQPDAAQLQVIDELLQVDRTDQGSGWRGRGRGRWRRWRSSPCPTARSRTAPRRPCTVHGSPWRQVRCTRLVVLTR